MARKVVEAWSGLSIWRADNDIWAPDGEKAHCLFSRSESRLSELTNTMCTTSRNSNLKLHSSTCAAMCFYSQPRAFPMRWPIRLILTVRTRQAVRRCRQLCRYLCGLGGALCGHVVRTRHRKAVFFMRMHLCFGWLSVIRGSCGMCESAQRGSCRLCGLGVGDGG